MAWTLVLGTASAGPAWADNNPADQALAQTLFDRGRELMTAKKYVEACEKFAESERLEPSVGTELARGRGAMGAAIASKPRAIVLQRSNRSCRGCR
jgi:hypothetical protein